MYKKKKNKQAHTTHLNLNLGNKKENIISLMFKKKTNTRLFTILVRTSESVPKLKNTHTHKMEEGEKSTDVYQSTQTKVCVCVCSQVWVSVP